MSANAQENQEYLITHGVGNLWEEKDNFKGIMSKMNDFGCNSTVISIQWERIYSKFNTRPDWSIIDDQVAHALKLNWKIGFRIYTGRAYTSAERDKFWPDEETAIDFKGKPMTIYYNRSHPSFFADAAYNKPIEFIKEVVNRYKYLQSSNKLIFFSIVTTNEEEFGYAHQNEQYPNTPRYDAIYDHSKYSMIKWKDWIQKKYSTIRTLNAFWGMNYRSFKEVEPNVNYWNPKSSFTGIRGKEWYLFRHLYLKKFLQETTKAIKEIDNNIKVAIEAGSYCDNISYLRGTLAFIDLSNSVDFIKYNDSQHQWSIDFIRSNSNKTLFSEVSVGENSKKSDELIKLIDYNFSRGCKMMYFAVQTLDDIERSEAAIRYSSSKWKKQNPINITPTKQMSYTLSEIIDDYPTVIKRWQDISENGKHIVDVKFYEDILILDKPIEKPLPDIQNNDEISTPPPVISNPDKINQAPVQIRQFEAQVVYGQEFYFNLPFDVVRDIDGFIALTELYEAPPWLKYSRYEQLLTGKSSVLGVFPFSLKFYDNNGLSTIATFKIEVVPPRIDLELIKAGYFDEGIKGQGMLHNNREILLEKEQEPLNIVVRSNLDSVKIEFNLNGPFKHQRVSKYGKNTIHSLFQDGRGFVPPIGKYTLDIRAIKDDSIEVIKNQISFLVKPFSENEVNSWIIYPNPFLKVCNIIIPSGQKIEDLNLVFYDLNSKEFKININETMTYKNNIYIDTDKIGLSSGIYILKVSNQKGEVITVNKVVKL
ncbi:MAG: beta-galactosidase [Spirosomaceae bacterium]|nr:beta-galactosidase [Spirosomataceae bacterium]